MALKATPILQTTVKRGRKLYLYIVAWALIENNPQLWKRCYSHIHATKMPSIKHFMYAWLPTADLWKPRTLELHQCLFVYNKCLFLEPLEILGMMIHIAFWPKNIICLNWWRVFSTLITFLQFCREYSLYIGNHIIRKT